MIQIQPSEKYKSMQFWDELFKSKGFQSLGYKILSGFPKMHWYLIPGIVGKFYVGMDDWYFRCESGPHFTVIWEKTPAPKGSPTVWKVISKSFPYPQVVELRLLLNALQDPRQTPVCVDMAWCSEVLDGITLPF